VLAAVAVVYLLALAACGLRPSHLVRKA
jgi:predicted small lipoprotein YifL